MLGSVSRESSSPPVARVLVAADHPIVRLACVNLVNEQPDLEVCGESSGDQTINQVQSLCPSLLIVDSSLGQSNVLNLIRKVKVKWPGIKLLILSTHDEALFADRFLRAGASWYVNKEEPTDRLIEAIRRVLRGEVYIPDSMAVRIMSRADKSNLQRHAVATLSNREMETFRLLGQGYNTRGIAVQIGVSLKTVESYRESIKKKLNIKSAAELVRHAIEWILLNS